MKFQLTKSALNDIRQITRHIRVIQGSPQNARLVARRLRTHLRKLARMPGMGYQHDEIKDEVALVSGVTGLLVVYDPKTNPLLILRVLHPARDLTKQRIR